jgi:hypothetical protein
MEVGMEIGMALIQRMKEDEEFRQKVNAYANGLDRLAFLKKEGYDFSPFIQVLDNLSSGQQSTGGLVQPGEPAGPRRGASSFLGRISQIFRATKAPHLER